MNRGFIQIPILVAIIAVSLLGGGAFVVYEVSQPTEDSFPIATTTTKVKETVVEDVSSTQLKDNEKDLTIDALKEQVEDLTKKVNTPKVEIPSINTTPQTTSVTLPSGAVVEMDTNGNIIRTIKEAPQQTHITPTNYNTQAQQEAEALAAQQREQEEKLAPLVASFDVAVQNISVVCKNADAGQPVVQCKFAISKLTQIIQEERWVGLPVSIAQSQRMAIQKEYYKLQDAYYQAALSGTTIGYIQGIQANIASQMQLLADAEALLY